MSPEDFRKLNSLQKLELILDRGQELMARIFLFYQIKLFALDGIFVEVWYRQSTNKTDRIILLDVDNVMELYGNQIKLDDVL